MTTKPQRRPLGANLAIGQRLDLGQNAPGPKAPPPQHGGGGEGARGRAQEPTSPQAALAPTEKLVSNSISLPDELWEELRRAAHARRRRQGGRTSVSALIRELLEQHRADWSVDR